MSDYSTLISALQALASVCDGAQEQDGMGFNGRDTRFGKDLAAKSAIYPLNENQQRSAIKMLQTYRSQLAGKGIELPAIDQYQIDYAPQIANAATASNGSTNNTPGTISADGSTICVKFNAIPSQTDRDWMKSIKGWQYNGTTRCWSFPIKEIDRIIAKFNQHTLSADLLAQRDAALAQKRAEEDRQLEITAKLLQAVDLDAPLPNGRTLFQHQKDGVMRMLTNRSQIVADDMGLGKTSQALVAAKAWQIAFDYPILVVGPVNLKDNWFREAAGVGVRIEFFSSAKMPEPLEKPYILIADEAHFFQAGTHSQRGKAFLDLSLNENCVACYPLTGTPIKNGRPVNLFPLLKAVKAEIANDKKAYEKRYCNAGPTRFSQWDTSGASHLDELHVKCKPYMIRRTKKECLDLPAKIRTLRHVEMSATARKAYDQAFADMRAKYKRRLAAGEISDNAEALVMLTHLRRAGSIAKVESALEMAEEILEQGNSVVLFTEFVESAESICKALSSYGAELLTGDVTGKDGDTGLSKRQTMVDRFQNKTSRVFISTIRAGGVGITLTAASDVLLVDRPWTPGDAEQAEDRCYRIGQAATVNTQWLQANGVDEKIDQLLLDKSKRISLVLEGERKTMRGTGGSVVDVAKELLSEIFAK